MIEEVKYPIKKKGRKEMKEKLEGLTKRQLEMLESVSKNHKNFKRYKPENQFYELAKTVIEKDGSLLEFVRSDLLTEELCLTAVQDRGQAIKFVPESLRTEEILAQAVRTNPSVIRMIKNQTEKLCKLAIEGDWTALRLIQPEYQTEEICELAIKKRAEAIGYVHNQTEKLCLRAVEENGWSLRLIKQQTEEMVLKAIENAEEVNSHFYYQYIKDELRTERAKEKIIEKNGAMLYHLFSNPSEEMIMKALKSDGRMIEEIKAEERTKEMALIAAKTYPEAIKYAPSATEAELIEAVSEEPYVFVVLANTMPQKVTPQIIELALSKSPIIIAKVEKPTAEMCMTALEHDVRVEDYLNV